MRRVPIFIVIAAVIATVVWWLLARSDQAAPVEADAGSAAVTSAPSAPQTRPAIRPIMPAAFQESLPTEGVTGSEAGVSGEEGPGSRRDPTVQVVVLDGDENKPLESYGVRCFPPPGVPARDPRGDLTRLRESGVHPGGVLELRGVAPGPQLLIVQPEGDEWAPAGFLEFEMTGSGAPRQEVTVRRSVEKTVRVGRKDGTPVVGTKIEIVRRIGDGAVDEVAESVFAAHLRTAWNAPCCLVLGETDDEGTVALAAPPREPLVLRVLGPGHTPVVRDVDFGAAGAVIDVIVPDGATLAGLITPHELLAQLDSTGWGNEAEARSLGTGVRLARRRPGDFRGSLLTYPLRQRDAPIAQDGTFRIEGVPAGRWEVQLRHTEALVVNQGGARAAATGWHAIGAVDLVDGAERQQTFELSHLLKGELEGIVTLDGKPLESGLVTLEGLVAASDALESGKPFSQVAIGAGGKFRVRLSPVEYRLLAQFVRNDRSHRMHDVCRFRVAAGQKLEMKFELKSSLLKLLVLASDGKTPVGGLELQFAVPDSDWPRSETTDAQGLVQVEGLPALEIAVRMWPKRLATSEARMADRKLKNHDDALITVKKITITPPETSATVVLPVSTGY